MRLEQSIGGYAAAHETKSELDEVYQNAARLINAKSEEMALCESATVAWTRAFYSMAEKQRKRGKDIILISEAEYAANVVAISQFAKDKKFTVLAIPSGSFSGKSTGIIDLQALDSILSGSYTYKKNGTLIVLDPVHVAIVCVTHIPTNSGIVNPVEDIGQRIASFNTQDNNKGEPDPQIFYLIDACQVK
jgi:selenocysteine lyase/cysteine desulfurase